MTVPSYLSGKKHISLTLVFSRKIQREYVRRGALTLIQSYLSRHISS